MHEANLYSELAAASALATVDKNDNWRAIPTSATNDVNLLQENYKEINGGSVPSINIEGRPFNVDIQESPEESVMDVYARIGQEHKTAMIFTRGKQEIEHIIKETKKSLGDEGENVVFRILHADLNDIEARHLTDPVEESQRLVIVATPAGMSGITIPGLTLVITDGTINCPELDRNNVSGIKPDYLSQAEIVQEAGRAGRDISGGIAVVAKPVSVSDDRKRARNEDVLDEEMAYKPINERKSFGPAEIYQSNLAREALTLVGIRKNLWDINDYLNHKVKPSSISNAHESLYRLGAIDIDEQITEMGMKMDSFPIRPELSRGVVEAMSQKRTITHMARIALMAASLDSGGVQEYNSWKVEKGSKPAWSALLRSTTKNDAIAQLDIMTTDMPTEEYPYAEFLYQNELSFKRIKQARKVARKIMRQCGVRLNNIIVPQYMNLKEEQLLLRDLTAGYLDYIHKNAGAKNHKTFFKNIHDSDNNEKRILSRSMVDPSSEYITGSLRWYLKNGTVHNVIEQAFPVEERVVKEYVESDAERLLIPGEKKAIIKDGQVIEEVQYMFGSIAVGAPKITKLEGELPIESQEKLFDYIMNHPGKNLSSIREVAQELEWLSERIPAEELDRNMLRNDIIANQDIQDLVKRLVKTNRLAYMVDDGIRRYMYDNYIDISSYLDDDVRKSFIERSPDVIYVNDEQIFIRYENGQPYTTQISQNIKNLSRKGLFLEDGREVLWQIGKGKNKRLVSLASSSD